MSEGGKKDIEATIKFPLTNANQWFRLLSGDVGRLYVFSVKQKITSLSMERHNHLISKRRGAFEMKGKWFCCLHSGSTIDGPFMREFHFLMSKEGEGCFRGMVMINRLLQISEQSKEFGWYEWNVRRIVAFFYSFHEKFKAKSSSKKEGIARASSLKSE